MSDEIQPQPTPKQSKKLSLTPEEKIARNKKIKQNRGALDLLPLDVRDDMEKFMREKDRASAKNYMIGKYGERYPILKELSKNVYYKYFNKHNVKNSNELALQLASAAPLTEIVDVINNITDPNISIADKKQALIALYTSCENRIKILEQRQTNFIDVQIEAVILQNKKEQHAILKTIATMQDVLSKDAEKNWLAEALELEQTFISAVVNSYKIVHTDQALYSTFMANYLERITEFMTTYRARKEALKKEPVKIS